MSDASSPFGATQPAQAGVTPPTTATGILSALATRPMPSPQPVNPPALEMSNMPMGKMDDTGAPLAPQLGEMPIGTMADAPSAQMGALPQGTMN